MRSRHRERKNKKSKPTKELSLTPSRNLRTRSPKTTLLVRKVSNKCRRSSRINRRNGAKRGVKSSTKISPFPKKTTKYLFPKVSRFP